MSHPSSVPLLPAREWEVLRRRDATLPVDFPGSDAAFVAGALSVLLTRRLFSALTTAMAWTLWGYYYYGCCYWPGTPPSVQFYAHGALKRIPGGGTSALPDDPTTDMDAMHPRHALLPSRRSARIRGLASAEAPRNATLPSTPMPAKRPRPPQDADTISSPPTKKWLDSRGQLVRPEGGWSLETATRAIIGRDSIFDADSTTLSARVPASRASHSKPSKGCKKKRGLRPPAQKIEHAFARGNVLTASTFSMLSDASVSSTGFQGAAPPLKARRAIDHLYYSQPRARALHPYISKFYPAYYEIKEDISQERSTFFVDRNGQIFMFRSFRAQWLMDHVEEVEVTHDILVGDDSSSDAIRDLCRDGLRGPHMPIIIGHQRQSSKRPHLTSWHVKHQARVDGFMAQPIVKRIINWISDVVEIVFPGIAHQFKQEDGRGRYKESSLRLTLQRNPRNTNNMPAKRTRQKSRTLNHGSASAPKRARVGNLAVTTDAPESNDAPEPPKANALLPTAFNLLRQLGVNPSGLLSAEVIKLQKQMSLNATANVAEPVAAAIEAEPSATNVVDKAGIEAHDVVLGDKYDLQALTEIHERVNTGPSGPARVEEHEPMSGYVENSGYCFGKN
ncbi:hypothetical protein B0H17DRAFT_1299417 [Mycena rosella]|uniref:Uncharacterized protein n=1 Tax=Mycena rosella TaxID=1033263 RepID=A0AAD7DC34_MYCRO|nr:hypothetical protein B0H17DRAFT_1299417 [Mycena rosella]